MPERITEEFIVERIPNLGSAWSYWDENIIQLAGLYLWIQGGGAFSGRKSIGEIKERGYADKYRFRNESINLIGVEFIQNNSDIVILDVEAV